MPRSLRLLGLVLAAGLLAPSAQAQRLQVDVVHLTDLDFGVAVQNQGQITRGLTNPQIAKFLVRARRSNNANRTLDLETILPVQTLFPSTIQVAYTPYTDDPSTATLASEAFSLNVGSRQQFGTRFLELYVYVYGSITVTNQPPGSYSGDITLRATLDDQ